MQNDKDKDTDELMKHILEASKAIDDWALTFGDKLLEQIENQDEDGLLDIGKLTFQDQTSLQVPGDKPSFFSQIPNTTVDEQTQEKILKFKLNFVSSRRKDELFKRQRKEQEQKITHQKKQMEKFYGYKMENLRNIKGQFTLRRGQQVHTCSITGDDLEKLRPEADLNDTIIANYLKYLQIQVFTEEQDKGMFIYSSFFIQKLVGQILKEQFYPERDLIHFGQRIKAKAIENYKNVQRWTRRVDIFQKDHLIIPINAHKHWFCLIVVNPGGIIDPKSEKRPYIVNCDSMFEKRFYIINAVRTYLQVELLDKKKIEMEITEQNFPCYQLILPRQSNLHDCGLYTLTYIEHLIGNPHELQNLQDVKNREKLHLIPRNLIFSMRQRLKDLFISLIHNSDENVRKEILKKYKQETQRLKKQATDEHFDEINMKQFRKYEAINSYLLQSQGYEEMSNQQRQFACKVKFYLDPEVNYYERDRNFFS